MKKNKSRIKIIICSIFILTSAFQLSVAYAHPHVFIVQRLNVVFDEKGLSGIKVRWKFDDMFASMIAEDHDINRNGKFETNEIQTVKEKAFSFISKHNYFFFINPEDFSTNDLPFFYSFK